MAMMMPFPEATPVAPHFTVTAVPVPSAAAVSVPSAKSSVKAPLTASPAVVMEKLAILWPSWSEAMEGTTFINAIA